MGAEMIATLAIKNLIHDRGRFAMTVVGAGASIVLVMVQLGLMVGFDRTISSMLDHARADFWVVPLGTAAFDDAALLDEGERFAVLSTSGVANVTPLIVGFAEWKRPSGGTATVILVGVDPGAKVLSPWNVTAGQATDLRAPETVAVDASYSQDLGVERIGDTAAIEGVKARVAAITHGIRSFTTSPYVFTSLTQARTYLTVPAGRATYLAVQLAPGTDSARARERIGQKLKNVEVLTRAEFRQRNIWRWLFGSGAGIALLSGAILGLVVGTMIVTQTLYASVKDHLREFATLRALGSSRRFLRTVIVYQAALSALAGSVLASLVGTLVVNASASSLLPVLVPPWLAGLLFMLALLMCLVAALAATSKVARVDPAMVFTR